MSFYLLKWRIRFLYDELKKFGVPAETLDALVGPVWEVVDLGHTAANLREQKKGRRKNERRTSSRNSSDIQPRRRHHRARRWRDNPATRREHQKFYWRD